MGNQEWTIQRQGKLCDVMKAENEDIYIRTHNTEN